MLGIRPLLISKPYMSIIVFFISLVVTPFEYGLLLCFLPLICLYCAWLLSLLKEITLFCGTSIFI